MDKLVRASRNYAFIGLASGFYYRELTRHLHYEQPAPTQLRIVHTHCFALGTLFFLIILVLEKQFRLSKQKNYKKFYAIYNSGLGIALATMLVKGTLTVLGKNTNSRWLSWTAGGGHILLTVGLYFFFDILANAVKEDRSSS